ncbi:hypothetical protein NLI96_g10121 [Meripilus lineatus]|uniref:Uncharacterized protein n=1 Tax=Meripilus lineatus TaxID=2056292 RepID=A0AAD5YAD2_9APHY|nr:hypothetical protein NLI96_g10121 [Physisporinus lineatus]
MSTKALSLKLASEQTTIKIKVHNDSRFTLRPFNNCERTSWYALGRAHSNEQKWPRKLVAGQIGRGGTFFSIESKLTAISVYQTPDPDWVVVFFVQIEPCPGHCPATDVKVLFLPRRDLVLGDYLVEIIRDSGAGKYAAHAYTPKSKCGKQPPVILVCKGRIEDEVSPVAIFEFWDMKVPHLPIHHKECC